MKRANVQSGFPLTIPVIYIRPLLDELIKLGATLKDLWKIAKIRTPLQDVLSGATATLPAAEFSRVYRCSVVEVERLCCARDGRRPMGRAAMDMLCYSVIHCDTLHEVIMRSAQFNLMMEERGGVLDVEVRDGVARFTVEILGRGRDCAALLIDFAGLYYYYQLFSWLIRCRLPLIEVGFTHAELDHALPALQAFGAPVKFNQPINSFSFAADYLEQGVVRSYVELLEIIDLFPFDMPLGLVLGAMEEAHWGDHLRLLLLDSLQYRHQLPALTTVAELLHISTATLRRRLDQEGTSYAKLRAQCQREIAEGLLRQTTLSVGEIAERLDFSEYRAFRRAFCEWTGETPNAYRERIQGDPKKGEVSSPRRSGRSGR